MLTYEAFAVLITILVLAQFLELLFYYVYLFLKNESIYQKVKRKNSTGTRVATVFISSTYATNSASFLFNTLNTILSLARLQRTDEVVKSLEIFSLFLKGKYKTTDLLIPISEELAYTNYYIEIQKMRFRSRLSINITSSEDLQNAYIPPFVIQTLVENSFKHGLEKKLVKLF